MSNYENEIRNHIKTEQQLKLYIEGVQDKQDEATKKIKTMKQEYDEQTKLNTKLQQDIAVLGKNLKTKINQNKSIQ